MASLTGIDVVWTTTPYTVTIARSTGNALIQVEGPGVDGNPNYVYSINLSDLHDTFRDFEDSEEGIVKPDIHSWTDPKTIGGVTLAAVLEIRPDYQIEFEDGQYAVVLDGANQNISDLLVVNQVSIRSKNSAGLQNLDTLLASAYQDAVHVHTVNGQAGTSVPLGTRNSPVNNLNDAYDIADALGISTFILMNDQTIPGDLVLGEGHTFRADNINTVITVPSGADVTDSVFENMTIEGTLDNNNTVDRCIVLDLGYLNGYIVNSGLIGTITIGGMDQLSIIDCESLIAGGVGTPTIDMGGSGNSLAVRGYNGGLKLMNCVSPAGISIDMDSGRVIVDPTVSGGDIYIRGVADVTDNSTGGNIYDQTINKTLSGLGTPTATISIKDMILIGELAK